MVQNGKQRQHHGGSKCSQRKRDWNPVSSVHGWRRRDRSVLTTSYHQWKAKQYSDHNVGGREPRMRHCYENGMVVLFRRLWRRKEEEAVVCGLCVFVWCSRTQRTNSSFIGAGLFLVRGLLNSSNYFLFPITLIFGGILLHIAFFAKACWGGSGNLRREAEVIHVLNQGR